MAFKVESSSCCKDKRKRKKKKTFKDRMQTLEKMFHELTTLCDLRGLLYVKSEFNKDGLVRILPENPNQRREIVRDYINYDPKTAGKRKGGDSECTNDNKMRKFSNGDVKEENQQDKFIDQKLNNLSVEEIERNLEPMLGMISERIDKLMMEKNKSVAKGCNEDDMVMMNEFPSPPLEPSSSTGFPNYSSALEKEFDYDVNQWLNLPGLTNTSTDGGIMFEPFPDVIDFEFQALSNYAGSFTNMMINCC
ncbi:uncharacterized protein LOC113318003 [Papaver somniferum]|uniref:uncharacterized protein LOC113318003 n=1 Tax=Papaver somniferum TaxID=3469 RepID=UPI000E6F6426|nr:uncharacterized protein LOC113318003 [Papaver somniferum]XP_026421919.1 uncharacterized protein LOC113318003 [Papaver somniferum]